MTISEKCAYVKGLAEGLKIDDSTPEGKVISELIKIVSDISGELEDIHDDVSAISEEVDDITDEISEVEELTEELDHDLGHIEEYLLECDEDFALDDGDDDECCCDDCELYEVECPHCGEECCFDAEIDPLDMICPACGEHLYSVDDLDDEDEETSEDK